MDNKSPYRYHFRPAYGQSFYLLEFFSGVENEDFLPDFLNAIQSIHPWQTGTTNLWMNDEVIGHYHSDQGRFEFSFDVWDLAFIMAEENQPVLYAIDGLLQKDSRFAKVETDPANYKLP